MGEKVRRIRLLLAVCMTAMLGFALAWPSQGAVTETPLYLARERGAAGSSITSNTFLAVADAPRLTAHLLEDGEQPADVEIIDSAGRVVVFLPDGKVEPTGVVLDPDTVTLWLQSSFGARTRALNYQVMGGTTACVTAKQRAQSLLKLPGDRYTKVTLAETLVEADARIAAMHQPANQIPLQCVSGVPSHKAGYLHNLWHRIMDS